jgi:hypothetical protein
LTFNWTRFDELDSLLWKAEWTKVFNQFGLPVKTIHTDSVAQNIVYDGNFRTVSNETNFVKNGSPDSNLYPNLVKYKYLRNRDTVIVVEYTGIIDTSSDDLNWYRKLQYTSPFITDTSRIVCNHIPNSELNSLNILYIYFFQVSGQLVRYERFEYVNSASLVKRKCTIFNKKSGSFNSEKKYVWTWVSYMPISNEVELNRNLKFSYYD